MQSIVIAAFLLIGTSSVLCAEIIPVCDSTEKIYNDSILYANARMDSVLDVIGMNRQTYFAILLEYGGSAGMFSYGADFRFMRHYSLRFGAGGYSDLTGAEHSVVFFTLNYLFLPKQFHFETGVGLAFESGAHKCTTLVTTDECISVVGTGFAGIRIQPFIDGLIFRFGYTPVFTSKHYSHRAALAIGYSFFFE
jgi:hypothetical protein